ncbi:VOC family protein [Arthrobacter cavernae]|uniref:VOC family protein n=1 Tax=Arthrobacter cavernae TaxID=2817681 RepID=A0A939KL83_9MICC|nr:VOC family protein [Arthrobacter cavernae]MBO1269669.1 VOC family protein [Arthrobacter cavernae]
MAGEPAFFEIGVEDPERGKAFYGALFGWDFTPGPSGRGGFMIGTSSAPGTAGIPGGLHGGDKGAAPYLFFRVDELDAALARVRELGGSVDGTDPGDEDNAAEYGRFKLCKDDQGSVFGLYQPPAQ